MFISVERQTAKVQSGSSSAPAASSGSIEQTFEKVSGRYFSLINVKYALGVHSNQLNNYFFLSLL